MLEKYFSKVLWRSVDGLGLAEMLVCVIFLRSAAAGMS